MKKILLLTILIISNIYSFSQAINVSNIGITGRFNSCSGSNIPNITATLLPGSNATVVGGAFNCNNPCDSSTIQIAINNIRWNQTPNVQWVHGIFLPVNAGFTITAVGSPAGFIAYNPGCTGQCAPPFVVGGAGLYYDNTNINSCCPGFPTNDGLPYNNWGQSTYTCSNTFNMVFNLRFCNSVIANNNYTFVFTGTSDAQTGCWGSTDATGPHTIQFTIATNPCNANSINPTAQAPVRTCVGNNVNYTSTLTGTCSGLGTTLTWWDAPTGGNQVGTGSPFIYDPAGSACPAGTTLYATCCPVSSLGCVVRVPITIPGTCNLISITGTTKTNPTCTVPGSINSVSVINGNGALSYTLNPGAVTNSTGIFNNLNLSSYTVTVTDAGGCTASSIVTFTLPLTPTLSATNSPALTCLQTTSNITATVSGGTPFYQYSLNGGGNQLTNTFNGYGPGTYTITVTDFNNCTATTVITLSPPPTLTVAANFTPITTCNGTTTITTTVSGGTSPYQYQLNGGPLQGSNTFLNINSGTYTISVTDANNCTGSTTVFIASPNPITVTANAPPILCNNGTTTITANGSGGSAPYQYQLNSNPLQGSNTFLNISAGTYTITSVDNNNCIGTTVITITNPLALTLAVSTSPILCFGNTTTITTSASGGTTPYQYQLNNNPFQIGNTFTNISSGTYTITIKDANNCSISTVITINQPNQLVTTASATPILCNGDSSSITASATGGTAPYQFSIGGPFQVGNVFNNLIAGNYTITAQDANNCTASTVITIAQPNPLLVSISAPPIACFGGTTTISATASGGTAPYQFSNGGAFQAGNTFANTTFGSYTITVQDANNCTATSVITITQPPVLIIDSITNTIPSCVPGNDATITVTATGGTPPLQYSNGGPFQNSNIFLNVGAGTYTITVLDANNCSVTSTVLIAPPNAPQWQNQTITNVLCFGGNTGAITISATGSNPPLTYTLMPGNISNATGVFNLLIAGNYTVTVSDANNCSISTAITINQPNQLVTTASATPILCNGDSSSITASATGGTAPYQFSIGGPFQVGNVFNNLIAGNYTITAQDANNCTASTVITIAQPNPLLVSISAPPIACFGGTTTISATASGGTAPYQFSNGGAFQAGNTFANTTFGSYTITVQDANNCTATSVITITQPPVLIIDSITNTIPSCVPGNDATITVTVTGGTPPLQYSNGGPFQNSNIFLNVGAGAYTITVMDANNCSVTSTVLIAPPNAPNITSLTLVSPSCIPGNDGSISIFANSLNPPLEYSIGGPFQISSVFSNLGSGTYTVTVKDVIGCTNSSITTINPLNNPIIDSLNTISASCVPGCDGEVTIFSTPVIGITYSIDNGLTFLASNNFTNLCIGNYTVIVKDANGCTATSIFTITNPNGPIFNSVTNTPILCFNDSNAQITTIATSPNGGITYTISPNLGTQNPAGTFNNLPAGTYTITATDASGCATQTIVTINQPTILQATIVNITNVLITNTSTGIIVANASGGTPNYTYTISPNIGNQNPAGTFNNLPAGSYTITATDANGCVSTTIAIIIEPNPMFWTSVIKTNNLCYGDSSGSIAVTAIGGLGPITYSINPNIGNQNPIGTFNNLIAGTYTLTATDSVQNFIDTVITIIQPTEISVSSIVKTIPSCVPGNDATISISANGGTGLLTYSIFPTAGNTPNNSGNFINLTSGNYTLTITDINNCFKDTIVTIDAPLTPTITIQNSTNVLCFGGNNGQLVSLATSGNGNISSYSISPNIGNQLPAGTFNNIIAGNYTITATDIKGCTASISITITEPPILNIDSLNNTNITCNGANDGEININASGGTINYNYSIDNGTTFVPTNQFNNLSAGIYTVIVKDANDCTTSQIAIITEPNPILINPISTTDITCFGINNGAIVLSANGGTTPYNYILNPGNISSSTGSFSNLFAGNYTVTVVDFNNCSLSTTYTLNEPSQILFTNIVTTNVTCFGDNSGAMEVIANGGTGTINYTINPLIGTQTSPGNFINLFAGNYTISAIDANNCSVTTIVVIGQNPEIIISNVRYVSPTCWGESNGQIDVTASGGVGALIYQINGGSSQTTGLFTNLASGYITISIIDGLNCRKDSILFLSQPDKLSFSNIESTPVTCYNSNDGKISATGTGGNGNYTYYLRPGLHINKHGSFSGLRLGTYTLTIIDTLGCEFDTLVFVSPPLDPLRSTMTKKDIGCFGYGNEGWAEVLVEGGEPPYTYLWTTNPAQTTPKADSIYFGKYFVNIIDALGCEIQDTVYIEPGPCCEEVFVPTAFSPNGDQINDVFQLITAAGLELHQFEIFNRWGQKVWYTNNYYDIWDGTFKGEPCPIETYHFVFQYKCLTDGKEYIKKGDVTLIR
ncbi:MAG: gliding motility-associated C-terminal domain-containing protein [Chitinophagaceae bacterium]|nr:gliding motility-associated C-terminal domain-containing protein [Chitinophagaceae bacterium]